jgi:hypothetical protein
VQPASAAGGSDAAFTANSAGNDEDPALRASSAAHGAHGRCSMACTSGHTRHCRRRRHAAAAAAAAAAVAADPCSIETSIQVEPWAAAPRLKYQPQTHNCRTVVGLRVLHAPARHNPSGAGKHGREQPRHAAHRPPDIQCRPSRASRADENLSSSR